MVLSCANQHHRSQRAATTLSGRTDPERHQVKVDTDGLKSANSKRQSDPMVQSFESAESSVSKNKHQQGRLTGKSTYRCQSSICVWLALHAHTHTHTKPVSLCWSSLHEPGSISRKGDINLKTSIVNIVTSPHPVHQKELVSHLPRRKSQPCVFRNNLTLLH